ncbi:MAG: hypothetical protein ACXVAX_09305, partial [Pseudobdellovibrio sp.]
GASVSDEDTYPAQLNTLLNSIKPGKFQVWNGGITAAVLSQNVEYARRAVQNFKPDLIIFQDYINFGRRPFLNIGDHIPELSASMIPQYFHDNPELYAENIPFLYVDNPSILKIHNWLVQKSEFYRLLHILYNNSQVKLKYPHHQFWDCGRSDGLCDLISRKYSEYGDMVNNREFAQFLADYPEQKVLLFDPLKQLFCGPGEHFDRNVRAFSFCRTPDSSEEYKVMHPPSYVYRQYAEQILNFLKTNNYIKL